MSFSRDVPRFPVDAQATAGQLERLVRAVEEQTAMLQRVSERIDNLETQLRELLTPESPGIAALVDAVLHTPIEEDVRLVSIYDTPGLDAPGLDPSPGAVDWRVEAPPAEPSGLSASRRRLLPEPRSTED